MTEEESHKLSKGPILGVRHVQVVMLFLAMVICFFMRVSMSMAIVVMTDKDTEDPFDWSMQIQSVILSSFFWGYIVLQIPSGEIAARFGGKILLTICIAVNSAVSLLIPLGAYYGGWQLLCACRVLQGLSQGCLYPTMHNQIGKWVPVQEKSRLGTLIYGEPAKSPECPKGFGIRHLQTLILFICLTIAYTIRSQLSVLMVAMVRVPDPRCTEVNGTGNYSAGCDDINANISRWNIYRTYEWNKSTQEMITFSFFVGYTSMMLPMGLIAQKYGGKLPIMFALAVNGVISICTPWIALVGGWIAVSASRLALGMTQAAMYPSIHTILAKWAPLCERGRLSTYIYTGSQVGTIIAFQLSGLFAGSPVLGWPVSFWLFGVLSLVSCGLLGWLVVASPHDHPTIKTEELAYIMQDIAVDIVPKKRKTPWKHILTSKPVWGLIATHAGSAASYLLILTEIPLYMNHILHVDLKRNGVYSSLPYIALYVMAIIFGYASDFAANRKIMSVVNIRRTANSIAMAGSGVFLFAFSFVSDTTLAVLLLIIAHGLHAGIHVGFHINHIDLAPNFAGPVMALGNMIANLTSLLVPVIVSNVVKDDVTNHRKWEYVFVIFVAIMFISNAIFVVFAKGTVQPWNFYGEEENDTVKNLTTVEEKKKSSEDKVSPQNVIHNN